MRNIRFRVVIPKERREWEEPYVRLVGDRGASAITAVLEVQVPDGRWEAVEVVYEEGL